MADDEKDDKKKGLIEGFASGAANAVRSYFSRAPEQAAIDLRRGGTPSVERAGLPYNLVSQFGYDTIAEYLRIDQDLQARYSDYEEMDEYPEITCLAGRSMVFTLEWGWRRIDELADVGGGFRVLSYDIDSHSLVEANVDRAWMSAAEGHEKPMVRVTVDNRAEIFCTADHPFLLEDETWVEAGSLVCGQSLARGMGFDGCSERGRVTFVRAVDERPAVYDLTIHGFHNFVCNGVVVHNTALDIYADDATMPNHDREVSIWAKSEDMGVQKDLNEMLHKRLLVDEDVWGVTRTLCKYGNCFGEQLVTEQGLVGLQYIPPPTVRRVEDPRGNLLGFIQDIRGEFNISLEDFYALAEQRGKQVERSRPPGELTVFEDWEVIHWRLRGKHLRSVYGHGVIDPARWIWKRLSLLEDALLIYKLERAPARFAFYVDIGTLDAERGLAHVNRVKNNFTRKRFVNPSTGKLDMRYNPLAGDEDIFIPVRDGKRSTEIDILQGPDYSETDSLEYHRDKLVSALKIPKTYMGYGGESTRSALSSEDIRFARTVMRIQNVVRGGYRKACRVHLIAKGAEVDRYEFDVKMSVPSQILELAKVEVLSATADLAGRMGEYVSSRWLLVHLFKFTEEEAVKVMKEREGETLDKGRIEAQVQQLASESDEQPVARGGSDGSQLLEQRMSRLLFAQQRNWEREFDAGRKSDRRLETKLEELLRHQPTVKKRLARLEGFLGDIRGSIRSMSPT